MLLQANREIETLREKLKGRVDNAKIIAESQKSLFLPSEMYSVYADKTANVTKANDISGTPGSMDHSEMSEAVGNQTMSMAIRDRQDTGTGTEIGRPYEQLDIVQKQRGAQVMTLVDSQENCDADAMEFRNLSAGAQKPSDASGVETVTPNRLSGETNLQTLAAAKSTLLQS